MLPFDLESHLLVHQNTGKSDEPLQQPDISPPSTNVKCEICEASVAVTSLKRHQKLHSDVKVGHQCDECGAYFSRKDGVKAHKMRLHVEKDKLKCDLCAKELVDQRTLNIHVLAVHHNQTG